MKIKGAIITGLVFIALGAGITTYAASRADFKVDNIIQEENVEAKKIEFENENIKSINYKGSLDYMTIKYSPEVENIVVNYSTSSVRSYTIEENDNVLNVNQKFKTSVILKGLYLEEDPEILFEIVVPYELTSVSIDLDSGYVKSEGLTVTGSYDVKINAGYLNTTSNTMNNANIKLNSGYINSKDMNVSTGTLKVNAGYIKYTGTVTTSLESKVNAGYIDIILYQDESLFTVDDEGSGSIIVKTGINAGYYNVSFK